jgi:hypothetical protein
MQPFLIPAMGAVTLTAVSSVALMRRGSSMHLRWCLFSFCLMALTQGGILVANAFQATPAVTSLLQLLLAGLSLEAMYLVSAEIVARSRETRRQVQAGYNGEAPGQPPAGESPAVRAEIVKGHDRIENPPLVTTPVNVEELEKSTLRATADLLLLLGALTASSEQPSPSVTVKKYLAASRSRSSNQSTTAVL